VNHPIACPSASVYCVEPGLAPAAGLNVPRATLVWVATQTRTSKDMSLPCSGSLKGGSPVGPPPFDYWTRMLARTVPR
jgi:hypothetical protein